MATIYQQEIRTLPAIPSASEEVSEIDAISDPGYIFLYDYPVFTDATADATDPDADDVMLWPSPVNPNNDAIYFGHSSQFRAIKLNISTAGVGTYAQAWQYYNGSTWITFISTISTSTIKNILNDEGSFKAVDADACIVFNVPDDWAMTTVNGQNAYWIRTYVWTGTVTTSPLAQQIWIELTSQSFSDTLEDTISLTDALTESAEKTLEDTVSLADVLAEGANIALSDSTSFSDVEAVAYSRTLSRGTEGGLLSDSYTQNSVYYTVTEVTGTPGVDVEFDFSVDGVGRSVNIYGRYDGNLGHSIYVYAWNGSSWDIIGQEYTSAVDSLMSFDLESIHTIAGNVKIKFGSVAPGHVHHVLYFDHLYVIDGSDELIVTAGVVLTDSIALTDAITQTVSTILGDSIGLATALYSGLYGELDDSINITDAILADGITAVSDIISLSDNIQSSGHSLVDDSISMADLLSGVIGIMIPDAIYLSDNLDYNMSDHIADSLGLSDALSGVLTPGFVVPGEGDVSTTTIKGAREEMSNWRKDVSNEPSPITAITRSSNFTVITNTTVLDNNAWDLSYVTIGDVVITSSDHLAVVKEIGVNTITIRGWEHAGSKMGTTAANIPPDGSYVTIHKMVRAKRIMIKAHKTNTDHVYLGAGDDSVESTTGHPIGYEPGSICSEITIEAPADRWLNLSRLWVVSGSQQRLDIQTGGIAPIGGGHSGHTESMSDSLSTTDNLSGILTPGGASLTLLDNLSLSDVLSVSGLHEMSDGLTLADAVEVNSHDAVINLSDIVKLIGETLITEASIPLSESIGVVDGLSGQLNPSSDVERFDAIGLGDGLSGVLTGPYPSSPPIMYDAVKVGDFLYTTAYQAAWGGGVMVFNVSDPTAPTKVKYVSQVPVGISRHPMKIIEDPAGRDYLFATSSYDPLDVWPWYNASLVSLDISVPGDPVIVDEIGHGDGGGGHTDLCGYGNKIYISLTINIPLLIYNTNDPTAIINIPNLFNSRYWLYDECVGGIPGENWHHPYDVDGSGNFYHSYYMPGTDKIKCNSQYIVIGGGRLWWIDRSDAPVAADLDLTPGVKTPSHSGGVGSFDMVGNTAHIHYTGCNPSTDYTYQVIGKGKAEYPSVHGTVTNGLSSGNYHKTQVSGSYAYLKTRYGAVSVMDVTTGIEVYIYTDVCLSFHISGNYLYYLHYVSGDHHLDIYDISVPTVPVLVGTCSW